MERKTAVQAEKSGVKMGRIFWKLSRKHRDRTLENLERAFPELSTQERLGLAKRNFEHIGIVASDFLRSRVRQAEEMLGSTETDGVEHLETASAAGQGILLISGHFGSWERLMQFIPALGYSISAVARDANDPLFNDLVVGIRTSTGLKIVSRGEALTPVLAAFKNNEIIGVTPDQNSWDLFIPFFGHPCGTGRGPGIIWKRTKVPVIPVFLPRVGPGQYRLVVKPPLAPEPGFDPIEGMMRSVNASIEAIIREYPEQYLWMHNRWKSAKAKGLVT